MVIPEEPQLRKPTIKKSKDMLDHINMMEKKLSIMGDVPEQSTSSRMSVKPKTNNSLMQSNS